MEIECHSTSILYTYLLLNLYHYILVFLYRVQYMTSICCFTGFLLVINHTLSLHSTWREEEHDDVN